MLRDLGAVRAWCVATRSLENDCAMNMVYPCLIELLVQYLLFLDSFRWYDGDDEEIVFVQVTILNNVKFSERLELKFVVNNVHCVIKGDLPGADRLHLDLEVIPSEIL